MAAGLRLAVTLHYLARVKRWLQIRLDYMGSTVIRFDCNSSALRPFDDLLHDRVAALRSK